MFVRPATEADRRILWEWANDPETRAQSFNTDPIPWHDHRAWFDRVLADESRFLVIGCAPDPVGVVRFDIEADDATISVTIAPGMRGGGLGVRLIRAATAWFHERHPLPVTAWIRTTNTRSLRAFEQAGYERSLSSVPDRSVPDRVQYVHPGPH